MPDDVALDQHRPARFGRHHRDAFHDGAADDDPADDGGSDTLPDGSDSIGGVPERTEEERAARRLALAARTAGERMTLVPRGYLAALLVILLAAAGLVGWSVLGSVPTSAHLTGIVVHGSGPVPVPAPSSGTVAELTVHPGDQVESGQTVATVATPGGKRLPVRSPKSGVVLGIAAGPGDAVSTGSPIVSLDPGTPALTGWLFLPADQGFPVGVGSPVTARLTSAQSLITTNGRVSAVGAYPVTLDEISRMLGGLPAELAVSGAGPYRLVTVSLTGLGVTGALQVDLDGAAAARLPALIPLVADVETGSVRPIDALLGGGW